MCGSKVDFVDIDPHTFNMSPEILETKLKKSKKTRCNCGCSFCWITM